MSTALAIIASTADIKKSKNLDSQLRKRLDPDGTHICWQHLVHETAGGVTVRGDWLCKVAESDDPVQTQFDLPIKLFNTLERRELPLL